MRKLLLIAIAALIAPGSARAQQAITFSAGYFAVRGEDARIADDVIVRNLDFLSYDIDDFNNGAIGAEWLVALGGHVEAGLGAGFYRRTVPSVYADLINSDGSEIAQEIGLRVVPVTATFRLLPLGRSGAFQPYFGAGIGVFSWRYTETGEFVDTRDRTIFRNRYVASGSETGPVFLGGARFPLGDRVTLGGELRYHRAHGTVGDEFSAERIDLGGFTTQFTVGIGF
jgi:hypothetical protein